MADLTDEQRCARQLLARGPNGRTEALLLALAVEIAFLGRKAIE
jgi:hypothetical protein